MSISKTKFKKIDCGEQIVMFYLALELTSLNFFIGVSRSGSDNKLVQTVQSLKMVVRNACELFLCSVKLSCEIYF